MDLIVDGNPATSAPPSGKRHRRKPSISSRPATRSIRQSPIVKPQSSRRKIALSSNSLVDLAESRKSPPNALKPHQKFLNSSGSTDGSGPDSVSPEPLSDVLMPPPALKRASGKSPISALRLASQTGIEPVTPATLMKIQKGQTSSPRVSNQAKQIRRDSDAMEDIMLPESATSSRPTLTPIDTSTVVVDDESTPRLSAKTPKMFADSTPRTSALSPAILSPNNAPNHKRGESKSGRGKATRQASTPSQISPALRPKISPSLQPLVPGTGASMPNVTAETSALYLASKSNYQNILEGTHLPGVSYPETLVENLSSKRTSHKLAEQGRRDRMNTALKEIETLLPSTPSVNGKKERRSSGETEAEKKVNATNQSNSKASTLELAILYIKALQTDLKRKTERLEEVEAQLAATRTSNESTPDT